MTAPRIPGGYVKVPNKLLTAGFDSGTVHTYSLLVMFRKDNEAAFPSCETLGRIMRCSERTVARRLRALEDAGWIKTLGYKGTHKGVAVYRVNTAPGETSDRPARNPNRRAKRAGDGRFSRGSTDTGVHTEPAASTDTRVTATSSDTSVRGVTTENDTAAPSEADAVSICPRCDTWTEIGGSYLADDGKYYLCLHDLDATEKAS